MVYDLIDMQIVIVDINVYFIYVIDVKVFECICFGVFEIGIDFCQFDFENFLFCFEIFFMVLFVELSINFGVCMF